MWISLQWAQVTAGVGFYLLGEPDRFLPHAVGKWFLSLRDFLADSELTLEVANTYKVTKRRDHDRILMDDALAGWYTDSDIQAINRCRLYLQVECLSDICTADGLKLDPGLQLKPPTVTSTSTMQWPRQALPGRISWAAWRRFIQTYTRTRSTDKLRIELGQWTLPQIRIWPAYYEPSSQLICQQGQALDGKTISLNQTWQYHSPAATQTRRFLAIPKNNIFQDSRPASDAIPVTILRETTTDLRCSLPQLWDSPQLVAKRPTIIATFQDYVLTLPTWEQSLLINVKEDIGTTPLYDLLIQDQVSLLAASDCGHFDPYGSFGWVLGTSTEVLWTCNGIARGHPMSSYRAEGYGRMSFLSFLFHYTHFLELKTTRERASHILLRQFQSTERRRSIPHPRN